MMNSDRTDPTMHFCVFSSEVIVHQAVIDLVPHDLSLTVQRGMSRYFHLGIKNFIKTFHVTQSMSGVSRLKNIHVLKF